MIGKRKPWQWATWWDVLAAVALLLAVLTCALLVGCGAPQSARRVGAHMERDARVVHDEAPSEATGRLVLASRGMGRWLGPPDRSVTVEDFNRDVTALELDASPWSTVLKALLALLGVAGVATAAWGGNYVVAARRLLGVLTGAIERRGGLAVKREVAKTTGPDLAVMLNRWVDRAEDLYPKKGAAKIPPEDPPPKGI